MFSLQLAVVPVVLGHPLPTPCFLALPQPLLRMAIRCALIARIAARLLQRLLGAGLSVMKTLSVTLWVQTKLFPF